MDDERVSRIHKMGTIPVEHLLTIARQELWSQIPLQEVMPLYENAAKRGNVEAEWVVRTRLAVEDDTPMCKYYRTNRFKEAAEAGFVPAMAFSNDILMVKQAAILGDADALCKLGRMTDDFSDKISFFIHAADHGSSYAMRFLCIMKKTGIIVLDPPSFAKYLARIILYHRWGHYDFRDDIRPDESDPMCMYVFGRELQGYETIQRSLGFHKLRSARLASSPELRCIDFYLNVSHRARRSALYVVHAFRGIFGRDVARLVGKAVYKTREEWVNYDCREKKRIKR
jgi:hypothetical protein